MVEIPTPIEQNHETVPSDWTDPLVAVVEGARITKRGALPVIEMTARYPTALGHPKRCPIRIHRISLS